MKIWICGHEGARVHPWLKCLLSPKVANVPSSSIFMMCYTYAHSYPNRGSKWTHHYSYFAKKMYFLKLDFQDEGHLYVNCSLSTLTIHSKYFLSQFLILGILLHIPILIGFQSGRITSWKSYHILSKNVLFEGWLTTWRSVVF